MHTILVVDDDHDIREAVSELLRDEGYEVAEAEHGKAALAYLERIDPAQAPCLMLLDLSMPVMSGTQLLEALRESQRLDRLPVVVLSAGGKAHDASLAHRFIKKPFTSELLLGVVHEFCGRAGAPR